MLKYREKSTQQIFSFFTSDVLNTKHAWTTGSNPSKQFLVCQHKFTNCEWTGVALKSFKHNVFKTVTWISTSMTGMWEYQEQTKMLF